MSKNILVCGGGGFIGSHLVKKLKAEGNFVRVIDLKKPEFTDSHADDFIVGDLRDKEICKNGFKNIDIVYQLAADMGGAGFVFSGENDADIMHNSALINLNVIETAYGSNVERIFYSSSACMYPEYNQLDPDNPLCKEDSAYPAAPDSEYGWEKLFSERLYLAFKRNYDVDVKIARYHNIFGPEGTYDGGREKAPAALCRKVILAENNSSIDIWGDGTQTRSFLYIDECVEGTILLTNSNQVGPYNIGSEEMVSINQLAEMIIKISGKTLSINHIDGPLGVKGRNSDNDLIFQDLKWRPSDKLVNGLLKTYEWIEKQY